MLTFTLEMTSEAFPDEGAWSRVRTRFAEEAGKRIVEAVQSVLGTGEIYTLTPGYRERKLKSGKMRRYPGKADDQPLILTGAGIYEGLKAKRGRGETAGLDTFSVEVGVDPSVGLNPRGFDYAEEMERRAEYLGAGLALVEDQFPDLLSDIIVEELLL